MINKRSQVTVFIIIAVVIVAIVLFFLLFPKIKPSFLQPKSSDAKSIIEKCVKQETENLTAMMMSQGGDVNPENYKLYEDNQIQYLCYTSGFYKTCVNQEPVLIGHFENELKSHLASGIESCFEEMKTSLESSNYNVDMGEMNYDVAVESNLLRVNIERVLTVEKNGDSKRYESFNILISSPVYNLLGITQKILNGEAEDCNYDYVSYMMFYPDYDIRKFVAGDSAKIYTVKDKYSGKEFKFAVRSCVIPPGF